MFCSAVVFKLSSKNAIAMVKLKKRKLRNKLRLLRKLNIYKSLKSPYSKTGLSFWSRKQKLVKLNLDETTLMLRRASRGRFMTLKMVRSSLLVRWGKDVRRLMRALYTEELSLNKDVSKRLNFSHTAVIKAFPAVFSFVSKRYNFLFNRTVGSIGTISNVMILKNKRTQFYLTLLSNQFWGWKTDVSVYPGVVSSLFGARQKRQRVMYKKKDKSIMKVMQKSVKLIFPKVLEPKTKVLLIVRKKPKSAEVYRYFISLLVDLYKLKLDFILFRPEVRHCFIKLRRYARIKRRLRKSITKRVEGINNVNLSKESSYNKIIESYVMRSKI